MKIRSASTLNDAVKYLNVDTAIYCVDLSKAKVKVVRTINEAKQFFKKKKYE